jgi:hypothetical protein
LGGKPGSDYLFPLDRQVESMGAAIALGGAAFDEMGLHQAIDQTRDISLRNEKPLPKLSLRHAGVLTQRRQHIELRNRQAYLAQAVTHQQPQALVEAYET